MSTLAVAQLAQELRTLLGLISSCSGSSEALLRARSLLERVPGEGTALVMELGTEASVMGHPMSFEWMLASLMANARDAMPAGGVVEVQTSVVTHRPCRASDTVREEDANVPDARYVRITVTDQGHGVAKSLED